MLDIGIYNLCSKNHVCEEMCLKLQKSLDVCFGFLSQENGWESFCCETILIVGYYSLLFLSSTECLQAWSSMTNYDSSVS